MILKKDHILGGFLLWVGIALVGCSGDDKTISHDGEDQGTDTTDGEDETSGEESNEDSDDTSNDAESQDMDEEEDDDESGEENEDDGDDDEEQDDEEEDDEDNEEDDENDNDEESDDTEVDDEDTKDDESEDDDSEVEDTEDTQNDDTDEGDTEDTGGQESDDTEENDTEDTSVDDTEDTDDTEENETGDTDDVDTSLDDSNCPSITIPSFAELAENPKLPDPFTFLDGSKVSSKEDWACRRKEIRALAEAFIYGPNPGKPETLEATYNNGTLNVICSNGGNSIDFSVSISGAGDSPTPAMFNIGGSVPSGVADIQYHAGGFGGGGASVMHSIASESSRGSGLFFQLYPDSGDTGALMAWAWGASRIIDALEMTEGHNIDTTKLSAVGCSRNGKAAATIGLFDDRVALVAAQSPGSGTTSGWRIAEEEHTGQDPTNHQTAGQIYGEAAWLGGVFQPFSGEAVKKLPIDQHSVLALAWPRGLIMQEGTSDYWNCPYCSFQTMSYTRLVYEALGTPDNIAFPQPDHTHCAQNSYSVEWYNAFVNKFLKGDDSLDTSDMFQSDNNYSWDADRWQDGDVPTLD